MSSRLAVNSLLNWVGPWTTELPFPLSKFWGHRHSISRWAEDLLAYKSHIFSSLCGVHLLFKIVISSWWSNFFLFLTGSCHIVQASLKLVILSCCNLPELRMQAWTTIPSPELIPARRHVPDHWGVPSSTIATFKAGNFKNTYDWVFWI